MKTLKDIEFDVSAVDNYATVWKACDIDVLRNAAREHVKELEEDLTNSNINENRIGFE